MPRETKDNISGVQKFANNIVTKMTKKGILKVVVGGFGSLLVLVLTCFSLGRNDIKQGNNTRDNLFKLTCFECDFIVHTLNVLQGSKL